MVLVERAEEETVEAVEVEVVEAAEAAEATELGTTSTPDIRTWHNGSSDNTSCTNQSTKKTR